MFLAHSIRLRDPWQCEGNPQGGFRWTRTFHRPTGLEADDDLWLVLSGLPEGAKVNVNGHTFDGERPDPLRAVPPSATGVPPVPEAGTRATFHETPPVLPASFNLTPILADKNQIEIHIPSEDSHLAPSALPPPAAFPYDARLAIMARS